MEGDDALSLLADVSQLYVAKGKKVVHVNLKTEELDDEAAKKLLLGPSGNLRAPTLRKGKTLIVGFNEEAYQRLLG